LWGRGVSRVAGVDESGTGTLAGPVVAAACILP
jgi:ribonuclease HII